MIGPFTTEEIGIVAQAIRVEFLRGKVIKDWDKLLPSQRAPYLREALAALYALEDYRVQRNCNNT